MRLATQDHIESSFVEACDAIDSAITARDAITDREDARGRYLSVAITELETAMLWLQRAMNYGEAV